ncbi:armadillo-type protein [Coniochaeta sp. 2T2.1]|nr:armadillo-type protein [Coniochaeta sp. 2T2.1]
MALNGAAPAGALSADVNGTDPILSQILEALNVVHNPYSPNQSRQQAQSLLESVKAFPEAPQHGFTLASDKAHAPILRHYGLSLLEHVVKHKWSEYTPDQAQYLRGWILQLAQNVSKDDPLYIRTKIAQLWVEVAARCWGSEWMDMDELLVQMWQVNDSAVHKELVLQILETLSDEVFSGDSPIFSVRESVLSKACVEIFTPAALLLEAFPKRQEGPVVRCGEEGWLQRIGGFLNDCLNGDMQTYDELATCATRSLAVFYSVMPWAIPKAISSAQCVPYMCKGLATSHLGVQKAALEALHALYSRHSFTEDEFTALVLPMYDAEFVNLCGRLFEWSTVDAQNIDDDKYQFAKKFSEMISCLGTYLSRRYATIPPTTDIHPFLQLLLVVVQSQSLVVSIPVLVTWTRLLAHRIVGPLVANTPLVGPLLEICSSRLIRYESLPEDTEDPTFVLLLEDTDTIPERHAFLGNYRRYSSQVIESIVQLKLSDAFVHILGQAENVIRTLYDGKPALDFANYSKNSMPVLRVDAHFTVVESALKGYVKWKTLHEDEAEEVCSTPNMSALVGDADQKQAQKTNAMEADFEAWCNRLLEVNVEDPIIRKRVLQLLVAFSTTALQKNAKFMLKVLEHILMTWPSLQPAHKVYNEAIKELQTESLVELQRLASKMPDHLLDVYDQLEAKIQEMMASGTLDDKRLLGYRSFLFIIIHRASRLDPETRVQRLGAFVDPVKALWNNDGLKQSLSSYDGFCSLLALDRAQKYIAERRLHEIRDWGSVDLDDEGRALQQDLEDRQARLPLRATKTFLTYSVEKIDKGSAPYQASCALWQDGFPLILPELLNFLRHAHAAHNPSNWTLLAPDMQSIVGRVLTDRFWQAGISEGSKDDFYARVSNKKGTLEGLASSIRGTVRFVRETCYAIIYCMSRLDVQFYGFSELPGPLAHALFADSYSLSAHQVINLLNLVRYLVDHCPVDLRGHFLPPILAVCFQQMDAKITSEWDKLEQQHGVQAEGDALTEEMKAESILRQLTYTAVVMVADFLDPARGVEVESSTSARRNALAVASQHPSLRKFCLMQSVIVEPLLLFCMHAISMRDGRCCGVVLRVLRSIVPDFNVAQSRAAGSPEPDHLHTDLQPANAFPIPPETSSAIREFISSDVLKACISSLHDPYFVDSQKDIGALIAAILANYSSATTTPRDILLSLPGIKEQDVVQTIEYVSRPNMSHRQQRGLVLDLLKDLKGVSISEMGKLSKATPSRAESRFKRPQRSKMAQQFMSAQAPSGMAGDVAAAPGGAEDRRKTPDLEGIASMFEGS